MMIKLKFKFLASSSSLVFVNDHVIRMVVVADERNMFSDFQRREVGWCPILALNMGKLRIRTDLEAYMMDDVGASASFLLGGMVSGDSEVSGFVIDVRHHAVVAMLAMRAWVFLDAFARVCGRCPQRQAKHDSEHHEYRSQFHVLFPNSL